ncbi:MAG: ROK family protein [Acidimicrobiia bacterium]|nr:ROK family protein [Acidimicrobiia bacterium]
MGLDVGGTSIKGAAISATGRVATVRTETPSTDPEAAVATVVETAVGPEAERTGTTVGSVGLCVPGIVDESGRIGAALLAWQSTCPTDPFPAGVTT